MRDIGRTYAPLLQSDDEVMPGISGTEALFESEPIPAEAWDAFESSKIFDGVHTIEHGGLLGSRETCWFKAPQLPALIALIENELSSAAPEAREWLRQLVDFARRAHSRGVSITLVVGG